MVDLNPDEVVALGAAIQAGILTGELSEYLLLDVTPLSLGIETVGGRFARIIPRNTTIPTSETKTFTTSQDDQDAVEIHILQGERDLAGNNKSLGRFSFSNFPRAPRGMPRIDVTFDIDANGIVQVSAVDQTTGQRQDTTVNASSGLREEEIQRMIDEASTYNAFDQQLIEIAALREMSEALLARTNDQMDRLGDAIGLQDLVRLDKGVLRMREALEDGDPTELRAAKDALDDLAELLPPYFKSSGLPSPMG